MWSRITIRTGTEQQNKHFRPNQAKTKPHQQQDTKTVRYKDTMIIIMDRERIIGVSWIEPWGRMWIWRDDRDLVLD